MVKMNGVKISKGKNRKLIGRPLSNSWWARFREVRYVRTYNWREL